MNEGQTGQGEPTSGKAYGEMGRALLTPDEVMQLGREKAIVLPPAGRPFHCRGVGYWAIRDEFLPYREGAMQLYYSHPLVIDPNPYMQGARAGTGGGVSNLPHHKTQGNFRANLL